MIIDITNIFNMSTLLSLRTDLRNEIKIDPNWKIWSDSVLNSAINRAYTRVQADWNFEWREHDANTTITTVSWTQEYSLTSNISDFIRIELVRYEWDDLFKTTKVALKRKFATFTSSIPIRYYIRWTVIGLDPTPNAAWTLDIDYKKKLTALSSDSDTIDFPDDFDLLIIKYASYLVWNTARWNRQTAQEKIQDYQDILNMLLWTYIQYDENDYQFLTARQRKVVRSDVLI